jgi:hypothetical protein
MITPIAIITIPFKTSSPDARESLYHAYPAITPHVAIAAAMKEVFVKNLYENFALQCALKRRMAITIPATIAITARHFTTNIQYSPLIVHHTYIPMYANCLKNIETHYNNKTI